MKLRRYNGTMELTMAVFVGLLLVAVAVVWGLMPAWRDHARLEADLREASLEVQRLQQAYDRLYERKSVDENRDGRIVDRLENPADAVELRQWLEAYGSDVTVDERRDGAFHVRVRLPSPAAFSRLVSAFDDAPWLFALGLPVSMKKAGDGLEVTFVLEVLSPPTETAPAG
jgi:hypothetical protein